MLYEMVSGQRAFKGDDVSDTLAAVLRQPPDLTTLPASTPTAVRRLISRCLDRDARRRLRDIGEARIALDDPGALAREDPVAAAPHTVSKPLWRRAVPVLLAVALTAIVIGTGAWYLARPASRPPAPVTRFVVPLPEGQAFVGASPRPIVALSPDGTRLVYAANSQLFVRSMPDFEPRPIQGTAHDQGVSDPVFSPDGATVLFYVPENSAIERVPVTGGKAVSICKADPPFGISWGPDGIVFGQGSKGVMRVSPDKGPPAQIAAVKDGEEAYGPQILPGGEQVLFTIATGNDMEKWDRSRIVVQSIASGRAKTLVAPGTDARYLPTGHLVYAVEGALFATVLDLQRLEVVGPAVPVVDEVRWSGGRTTGAYHFSTSNSGALAYLAAIPGASPRQVLEVVRTDHQARSSG